MPPSKLIPNVKKKGWQKVQNRLNVEKMAFLFLLFMLCLGQWLVRKYNYILYLTVHFLLLKHPIPRVLRRHTSHTCSSQYKPRLQAARHVHTTTVQEGGPGCFSQHLKLLPFSYYAVIWAKQLFFKIIYLGQIFLANWNTFERKMIFTPSNNYCWCIANRKQYPWQGRA